MAKLGHFRPTLWKKSLLDLKVSKTKLEVDMCFYFLIQITVETRQTNAYTLFEDGKHTEGKTRPKLTDALFKEVCKAERSFSIYLKNRPLACDIMCLCFLLKENTKSKCAQQNYKR